MTNRYRSKCHVCEAVLAAGTAADLLKVGSEWLAICRDCLGASGLKSGRAAIEAWLSQFDDEDDEYPPTRAQKAAAAAMQDRITPPAAYGDKDFWPLGDPSHVSGGDVAALALLDHSGRLVAFAGAPTTPRQRELWLAEVGRRYPAAERVAAANTDDGYRTAACTYLCGPSEALADVLDCEAVGAQPLRLEV